MNPYDDQGVASLMPGMMQPAAGATQPSGSYTGYQPQSFLYQPQSSSGWGGWAPGQMAAMYNPFAYYSPNNYGYGYTPPNAGYGYGQGTGTGTGTGTGGGFFHMPGAPAPTPATPSVAPQVYYPPQGAGNKGKPEDPNPAWTAMSDAEKANWYSEHPNFSAFTQAGQNIFGYTGLGFLQNKLDPGFVERQKLIAQGINPTPSPGAYPYAGSQLGPGTGIPGQAIIGRDGSVISASDPTRWGSETNPTYAGPAASNPFGRDPAQQAQAAQAAAAAAAAQAANNTGYSGSVFGPSISAADAARAAASAASEGESGTNIAGPFGYTSSQFNASPYAGNVQTNPTPAAQVTTTSDTGPAPAADTHDSETSATGMRDSDPGGEGGRGEKKGGVIRRKKRKSNFADGGIVDLVRQYPWLLR